MANPFNLEEILPESTYGFSEGGKVKMRKSNVKSIVGELIQHFYGGGMVQPEYYQEGEEVENPEIELSEEELNKPSPITATEGRVPTEPIEQPQRQASPITGGSPTQNDTDYGENPQQLGRKVFNMYGGGKINNAYNTPNTDEMSFKDALLGSSEGSTMNKNNYRKVGEKYDLLENL